MNAEGNSLLPRRNVLAVASLAFIAMPHTMLALHTLLDIRYLPSRWALIVLILVLPFAAIVFGHLGVRASNRSGGLMGGKDLARMSLTLGYLTFLFLLSASPQSGATSNARTST